MIRFRLGLIALLIAATPAGAAAQGGKPLIKYGKWAVLAASIGMNILAADAHNDADRVFERISGRCAPPNTDRCTIAASGAYMDPVTEGLFQESLRLDTRAQRWLIAGEAALLGATVLFVWELMQSDDAPPDIDPFTPVVRELRDGVGVGFEIRF